MTTIIIRFLQDAKKNFINFKVTYFIFNFFMKRIKYLNLIFKDLPISVLHKTLKIFMLIFFLNSCMGNSKKSEII